MSEQYSAQEWVAPVAIRLADRLRAEIEAEQEQWFLWLPIALGLGISAYFSLPREPAPYALLALLVVSLVLHGFGRRLGLLSLVTSVGVAITFGACLGAARTAWVAAPVLVRQIGPVDVTGWIELVEPRATRGQRVTIRAVSVGDLAPTAMPYRIRVRTQTEDTALKPGQPIRLRATIGPPPIPAAPNDFDFGRLAWFARLGGIGLAQGRIQPEPSLVDPPRSLHFWTPIERLRQVIRERIIAALPGEVGEIATALITGERGGISESTNQAYRDSGLFHILSISGLHMVIMAGAVFYLLRLGFAAIPSIALRHPIKKLAAAGAILGALGYLLISGAAFATVRSYVMITIMFVAVMLDRPALALRNVAVAALLILLVFPESLFDAGFQMSFAAVVGLVSVFEWMRRRRETEHGRARDERRGPIGQLLQFVGGILLTTVIASLVVAPFGIYHFHNTQLLALVANVFAIPICNIVVMPAALGALIALPFGLEAIPFAVMGWGIDAMTIVARWVGALPGAVVKVPAIPTHSFALMIAGGLWLLLWSRPWRLLGIIPMAIGVAAMPYLDRPDMLIGREGTTVAIRGADGKLTALASRGLSFDLARWLELDGDRRPAAEVASASAFQCDPIGCMAMTSGKRVAVVVNPAALRDDCQRADILLLRFAEGRACRSSSHRAGRIIIDPSHLALSGAHALYLKGDHIRIETVADSRGARPWSGPLIARAVSADDPRNRNNNRLTGFSGLFERFRKSRPEIEDDAWPGGKEVLE
jgi:competence protein ComEC